MTPTLMLEILIILSIVLSIFSAFFLGNAIYKEYKARELARARYEKNPELDILAEDFYVPELTIGNVVVFHILWITPGINLISFTAAIIYLVYGEVKKVWNNPVIGW